MTTTEILAMQPGPELDWQDYRKSQPSNEATVLCWAPYYRHPFVIAQFFRDGYGSRFSTRPGGYGLGEEYVLKWARLPELSKEESDHAR